MKPKRKQNATRSNLNWIGIIALVITLQGMVLSLTLSFLFYSLITVPTALFVIWKFRYLNWQNLLASLILMIGWINPVRFLYDWWLNPVFYGVITIICMMGLGFFILRHNWKNQAVSILLVCSLASGWQIIESAGEIGNCHIEDRRWNHIYACNSSGQAYQQVEHLPFGLNIWCYYCPWY